MNKQEKLDALVKEVIRCKLTIEQEQQTITDLRHYAMKECGCDPKQFNSWVAELCGDVV